MRFTAALCAVIILLNVAGTTAATLRASQSNSSVPTDESLRKLQQSYSPKTEVITFVSARELTIADGQPMVFPIMSSFSGYVDIAMTYRTLNKTYTTKRDHYWIARGFSYIAVTSYPWIINNVTVSFTITHARLITPCEATFVVKPQDSFPVFTKIQKTTYERFFNVTFNFYFTSYFEQQVVAISNATDLSYLPEKRKTSIVGVNYTSTDSNVYRYERYDRWTLPLASEMNPSDSDHWKISFSAFAPLWTKNSGEPAPKYTLGFTGPTKSDYVTVYDYENAWHVSFTVPDKI